MWDFSGGAVAGRGGFGLVGGLTGFFSHIKIGGYLSREYCAHVQFRAVAGWLRPSRRCGAQAPLKPQGRRRQVNSTSNEVPYNGILLTDNVNIAWLESVTPRYHQDFVKFILSTETNEVVVGMDIHADGVSNLSTADTSSVYGGNIFFADAHVEYESTLNIEKNLQEGVFEDARVITDPKIVGRIEPVLRSWIEL